MEATTDFTPPAQACSTPPPTSSALSSPPRPPMNTASVGRTNRQAARCQVLLDEAQRQQ